MSNNLETSFWRQTILPSLSLFTSTGTLLCCALPALFVTLGMGASLAGFVGVFPWITTVSEYKEIIFTVAGVMISLSVFMQWRSRYAPCPVDPQKAKACMRLRQISWGILLFSVTIYMVGAFFAFFAADIFYN